MGLGAGALGPVGVEEWGLGLLHVWGLGQLHQVVDDCFNLCWSSAGRDNCLESSYHLMCVSVVSPEFTVLGITHVWHVFIASRDVHMCSLSMAACFVMVLLVIALSYVIAVLAMANFIVLSYAPQSICTAPNAGVDCFRCNITDTLGPFVCIAIMQCA